MEPRRSYLCGEWHSRGNARREEHGRIWRRRLCRGLCRFLCLWTPNSRRRAPSSHGRVHEEWRSHLSSLSTHLPTRVRKQRAFWTLIKLRRFYYPVFFIFFLMKIRLSNALSVRNAHALTRNSSLASAIFVPYYAGLDFRRNLRRRNVAERDAAGKEMFEWLKKQPQWKGTYACFIIFDKFLFDPHAFYYLQLLLVSFDFGSLI